MNKTYRIMAGSRCLVAAVALAVLVTEGACLQCYTCSYMKMTSVTGDPSAKDILDGASNLYTPCVQDTADYATSPPPVETCASDSTGCGTSDVSFTVTGVPGVTGEVEIRTVNRACISPDDEISSVSPGDCQPGQNFRSVFQSNFEGVTFTSDPVSGLVCACGQDRCNSDNPSTSQSTSQTTTQSMNASATKLFSVTTWVLSSILIGSACLVI